MLTTEALRPHASYEHKGIYHILQEPQFQVNLTFITELSLLGFKLRVNSWILASVTGGGTFVAMVNSLVEASCCAAQNESRSQEDLYFISANAFDVQSSSTMQGSTSGTIVVSTEALHNLSLPNIFVVGYVAMSELMCMS